MRRTMVGRDGIEPPTPGFSVRPAIVFYRYLSESIVCTTSVWLPSNQRLRPIPSVECRWFRPSTAQVQACQIERPSGFRILCALANS